MSLLLTCLSLYEILLLLIQASLGQQINNCKSRQFDDEGTVCVCDSDYCDTIPQVEPVDKLHYIKYTSNKAGLRFEKEIGTFPTESNNIIQSNQIILIDSETRYQTIEGWGGAFTDSFGINIKSLPDQAQIKLLNSYFSENGLEYSLCRVPIGGTDFSTYGYSYDDVATPDPNLLHFNLTSEDYDYKIPYIIRAQNLTKNNKLRLIASAWTAPKWLKTNGEYAGSGGTIISEWYDTWANYYIRFLDAYKNAANITFWAVTTGNEPSLALVPFNLNRINTVGWSPKQMRTWIGDYLGPIMNASDYSEIKIMMLDDQRTFLPWYAMLILTDTNVSKYIDGIAVHWYHNSFAPPELLTYTNALYPSKFILQTEASHGSSIYDRGVRLGSWSRGEAYSKDIIQNVNNWGSGWLDWNMALDLTGGPTYIDNNLDSPIIVNASAGEFYKQPMYYHLGHFSKFIPPGSVRVHSTTYDSNDVLVAGFIQPNENATTIVILNLKAENQSISLTINTSCSSSGDIAIDLSEKSITTILCWGN